MIITDIEMPLMDGHRLTKLVKEDDELKHIPVIIFSSLVNEEMRPNDKIFTLYPPLFYKQSLFHPG